MSVCVTDWLHRGNILESKQGNISAIVVLLEIKRLIVFYEKGIDNQRKGFCDYLSVDSEEEKYACIDYFGSPAVKYCRQNSNCETVEE